MTWQQHASTCVYMSTARCNRMSKITSRQRYAPQLQFAFSFSVLSPTNFGYLSKCSPTCSASRNHRFGDKNDTKKTNLMNDLFSGLSSYSDLGVINSRQVIFTNDSFAPCLVALHTQPNGAYFDFNSAI